MHCVVSGGIKNLCYAKFSWEDVIGLVVGWMKFRLWSGMSMYMDCSFWANYLGFFGLFPEGASKYAQFCSDGSCWLQHQGYGFRGLSRFGLRQVTVKLLQTQIHHTIGCGTKGWGCCWWLHTCVTGVAAGWQDVGWYHGYCWSLSGLVAAVLGGGWSAGFVVTV